MLLVMPELSEYFTVAEAAEELGVSTARVRALIDARILSADKVAGRWFVSPKSVHARKGNQRRSGRPLSSRNLWDLINTGFIAQLLITADEAAQHNIRVQLANRAEIHDVYVLPQFVGKICPLVLPGGRALAESANVPAGNDQRWELDGYVRRGTFNDLRKAKHITAVTGEPNVRLRVVVDDIEWRESRASRMLLAWLDLADEGDRAADITLRSLLDELHHADIQPFPVGNELMSRVTLGLLSALNDELPG